MKFGEYIKQQRTRLNLTQEELSAFTPSYIANIEAGRKNPTKRETIAQLAKALRLPENQVDWLWMYSMLDSDPRDSFAMISLPAFHASEKTEIYMNGANEKNKISIPLDASEQEIVTRLGHPDYEYVVTGTKKNKWIYEKEGIHIIFANGKVQDVIFK